METQRLQKEKWSEVHLPLLFIYMIHGQLGQLEKGPECLVLINHGSRRAIIYVSTPMWSFKSSFGARRSEASVLASLCLYFFIGAAEQILGAPLPDLFLGSSGHFSISCFHLVLCVRGNSKKGKKPTLCLPMRGWWAQRERGSWCSWYWSPNSTQCNNVADGQKWYEIVHI